MKIDINIEQGFSQFYHKAIIKVAEQNDRFYEECAALIKNEANILLQHNTVEDGFLLTESTLDGLNEKVGIVVRHIQGFLMRKTSILTLSVTVEV